jgi:hypothetical protein
MRCRDIFVSILMGRTFVFAWTSNLISSPSYYPNSTTRCYGDKCHTLPSITYITSSTGCEKCSHSSPPTYSPPTSSSSCGTSTASPTTTSPTPTPPTHAPPPHCGGRCSHSMPPYTYTAPHNSSCGDYCGGSW